MFDIYRNETHGDATTYVRPYQTISSGLLNENNVLTIFEEKITILSDATTISSDPGLTQIQATITNPNEEFNLINPVTGAVTGTKTFAALKVELYSLYVHLATLRDEAAEQQQGEEFPS